MSVPLKFVLKNSRIFKPLLVRAMPMVSDAAAAMLRTTVAFTMSSGSEGTNVLPQEAWVIANMRYSHHQGGKASIEAIKALAEKYDIETVVLDPGVDSPISDHNSDAYKLIESAVTDVFRDVKTTPYIMTAASDSRFIVCALLPSAFQMNSLRAFTVSMKMWICPALLLQWIFTAT